MSPEQMAGEAAIPMPMVQEPMPVMPYGSGSDSIAAANQKMLDGSMRDRFGPVYIPPLHRGHNRPAAESRVALTSDHQGSIREMGHMSGGTYVLDSEFTYDPWGAPTQIAGSGPTPDFLFQGMYYHPRSGLYLTLTRPYSPMLGKFLSRDPIGEAGGTNLYGYVGNNPIKYSDPSGLGPITAATWGAAGAQIGWWAGGGTGALATAPFGGEGAIPGAWSGAAIGGAFGYSLGWLQPDPGQTSCNAKPPKNASDPNGPKAPGEPGAAEGFEHPEGGPNWVPNPNGPGYGWEDASGNVWVPTGPEGSPQAHGGPHWDVQQPGGGYVNVYPGGRRR